MIKPPGRELQEWKIGRVGQCKVWEVEEGNIGGKVPGMNIRNKGKRIDWNGGKERNNVPNQLKEFLPFLSSVLLFPLSRHGIGILGIPCIGILGHSATLPTRPSIATTPQGC
jgi:hypothetical protein